MSTVLQVRNIHKQFPGVYALKEVDLELNAGEIHALMGENGAGKSTLIKILAGVYTYQGDVILNGKKVKFRNPSEAIQNGISVIYQELNLCLNLSVAENIFFARWPVNRGGKVIWRQLYQDAKKVLDDLGFDIDPKALTGSLSTAHQQLIEIAKAITYNARVLIMDEPTSALSPTEINNLFNVIKMLKDKGVAIVYVSHKLEEIFRIADRVTVLRDGVKIGTKDKDQLSEQELITMMVGRKLNESYPKTQNKKGQIMLDVRHVANDKLKDISFNVRSGEIVGFSGLMGAGRTELAKAIFGFDARYAGEVIVNGCEIKPNATWEAMKAGVGYIPEDRKHEGIFPYLSVAKNITISSEDDLAISGRIRFKQQAKLVEKMVCDLQIKTPSSGQLVEKLSGGNQQKVIVGRWLAKEGIKVLIVDEPTRGIDVGAKREIYSILNEFAKNGMAIVIMSSEMPEIIGMCDRIYVMSNGRITGEFSSGEVTQEELLKKSIV